MHFELLGEILSIETIASGHSIRELRRLNRVYGKTTRRKRKGIAKIRLNDGTAKIAELHWYEGHGNGKKESDTPQQSEWLDEWGRLKGVRPLCLTPSYLKFFFCFKTLMEGFWLSCLAPHSQVCVELLNS